MTENLMKSAYRACLIDNESTFGSYVSVSAKKLPGKMFSFDVWVYIKGSAKEILSQSGGFSMGVDHGQISFSHPEIGEKTVKSDLLKIQDGEWVNIFVSYDETKIDFAVTGTPVGSISCSGKALINDNDFCIGKGLFGYIKSFRLYDTAIAAADIGKYLFQVSFVKEMMSNVLAFMDFTQLQIEDLSPNGGKAVIHGGCTVLDLVHVYCPSKGKYAFLNQGEHVNPGGFASGCFSIYLKVYIRPCGQEKQVLYANGRLGEQGGLALYQENSRLYFQFGSEQLALQHTPAPYQWLDIIVNYDGKNLSTFVNAAADASQAAVCSRTDAGDFKIGNGFDLRDSSADYTCQHYIFMAAVFDGVLTQKDAEDFLQNHPFIYEDHLIALYSFEAGAAFELVGQSELNVERGDLIEAQRTAEKISAEPYQYRVTCAEITVSAMSTWKAAIALDSVSCFYAEYFGVEATISTAASASVLNQIAADKALLEYFNPLYTEEVVSKEVVAKTISSLPKSVIARLTKTLLPAAASAASAAAAAVTAVTTSISAFFATFGQAMALVAISSVVVSLAVAAIVKLIQSSREKKPDDDDDEERSIKLEALSYQHNPDDHSASAVRCRNSKGPLKAPEWTKGDKSAATLVYVASKIKTVTIKAKIYLQDISKTPASSCTVKLSAYNVGTSAVVAFNHLEYTGTLATNQTHEITLTAREIDMPTGRNSKSELEFYWTYEINGKKNVMPNTKCTVYVTPVEPAFPLSLASGDDNALIYTEFLDFASGLQGDREPVMQGLTVTAAELTRITEAVYATDALRYESGSFTFLERQMVPVHGTIYTLLSLRVKEMMDALAGKEQVSIECSAFAVILAYYFWTRKVQAQVVLIQSHQPGQSLQTNNIIPSKGQAGQRTFANHYIVEVQNQGNFATPHTVYFDASCKDAAGNVLANLPFANGPGNLVAAQDAGSYRGIVFRLNTYAAITTVNAPTNPNPIIVNFT